MIHLTFSTCLSCCMLSEKKHLPICLYHLAHQLLVLIWLRRLFAHWTLRKTNHSQPPQSSNLTTFAQSVWEKKQLIPKELSNFWAKQLIESWCAFKKKHFLHVCVLLFLCVWGKIKNCWFKKLIAPIFFFWKGAQCFNFCGWQELQRWKVFRIGFTQNVSHSTNDLKGL